MSSSSKLVETLRQGILDTPRHVPEYLQWLTEKGQAIFRERHKQSTLYSKGEPEVLKKMVQDMTSKLSDRVVLIELCAGLCEKSLLVLTNLLKDSPARKVCFIPIDCDECVLEWNTYIKKELPELEDMIVVKPMLGDMLESLTNIGNTLTTEEFNKWDVVFSLFGPTAVVLPTDDFINLNSRVAAILEGRSEGRGYWCYTYIQQHQNTLRDITEKYYAKIDAQAMMKAILMGLNATGRGGLDISKFDVETDFVSHLQIAFGGEASGWRIQAVSTEKQHARFEALDLDVTLDKDEKIRCSEDAVRTHFYPEEYLIRVGNQLGLKPISTSEDTTGLIGGIIFQQKRDASNQDCKTMDSR